MGVYFVDVSAGMARQRNLKSCPQAHTIKLTQFVKAVTKEENPEDKQFCHTCSSKRSFSHSVGESLGQVPLSQRVWVGELSKDRHKFFHESTTMRELLGVSLMSLLLYSIADPLPVPL